MAADAASLSTDTLAMSSGFRELISPSTLSIRMSGEPPLMLRVPLMLKFFGCPGAEAPDTVSPGTAPWSAAPMPVTGRSPSTWSILIWVTAPVRFTFFCWAKPTHTTSSMLRVSASRVCTTVVIGESAAISKRIKLISYILLD